MRDDLKIVYVSHYTDLYGANRSLLNLIDGLSKKGIQNILVIVPSSGDICKELEKRNVEYRIIPFVNETYYKNAEPGIVKKVAKFFYNWYIVFKNSKKLGKQKNIIIHSNSSATLIGAYFSKWLGVPHIWHIREFGKADYNYEYNFGTRYFESYLNKSKGIITISKSIYDARVRNLKVTHKKVIYNGVVFLEQMQKTYIPVNKDQQIVYGIMGVISEEKGQEEAIDAFNLFVKESSNTKLIIAGTGNESYVALLKKKISDYDISDKIVFTGFIDDTKNFYKEIHCLLMCSKNEGLGRVTIEAMSYGIPVIGYDNAGTSEIIINNYNGLLYRNGVQELSEMMMTFAKNAELQKELSDNAYETVKEKFTIEAYANEVSELYNQVLKN